MVLFLLGRGDGLSYKHREFYQWLIRVLLGPVHQIELTVVMVDEDGRGERRESKRLVCFEGEFASIRDARVCDWSMLV